MTETMEVSLIDVLNKIEAKIDKLDDKFNTKFELLDRKIDSKFEFLDKKIDSKFELLDKKIDSKFEFLDKKIDNLQSDLNIVIIDVEKLKTQNEQIVKRLDTVDVRLNTITLGVFGLVGVLVTGLLGIIGKIVFFPISNP